MLKLVEWWRGALSNIAKVLLLLLFILEISVFFCYPLDSGHIGKQGWLDTVARGWATVMRPVPEWMVETHTGGRSQASTEQTAAPQADPLKPPLVFFYVGPLDK